MARVSSNADNCIALIGLAGRFPGAPDLESFWRNLRAGVESVRRFSPQELAAAGVEPALLDDPRYVRARPILEGIELFDADLFGYTPREAALLDPQHRLFLECAWQALEDAGWDPARCRGRVGVYAGCSANSYLLNNLLHSRERLDAAASFQALTASDKDYLATRVSYKLGLTGPSLSVQTACSTSLVAVHLAAESLQAGECDLALAGGASVSVPQAAGYLCFEGGIYSPDGHCRPFDARAAGTLFGSGVGCVVLKRLEDALADGDPVRAVLLGSAVNNDGARKVGYTAPGIDGQAEVVAEALGVAGIDPASLGMIEAHATGTSLGDPIEIAALTRVFREFTDEKGFCAVGGVKSNVGHLEAAAGIAGLLKAVLSLQHGEIPPSLHFETPNPALNLPESPFYVNRQTLPWPTALTPRRAGVSSFGIGGTNAHLILEQAPEAQRKPAAAAGGERAQLLVLSTRAESALEAATERLGEHLARRASGGEGGDPVCLAEVAYTLAVGRRAFSERRVAVCSDAGEAVRLLTGGGRGLLTGRRSTVHPAVAFLFPGQGAQHPGMGQQLYQQEETFRREVDRAAEILAPQLGGQDLRQLLYPQLYPGAPAAGPAAGEGLLDQTRFAQPALFTVELALARLWQSWGVVPAALLGHSIGEYVAATLAGVFSDEDALSLVAVRGELLQAQPSGAMLAVPLGEEEIRRYLPPELSLAAANARDRTVVAGPRQAVDALAARLAGEGVATRLLPTSHAFHSPLVEGAVQPFLERLRRLPLRPPALPFLSAATGTWMREEEAVDPAYWAGQLRRPVRFADALGELLSRPDQLLLEVGPGHSLGDLARRHPARNRGVAVLSSLGGDGGRREVLTNLGRLWLAGVEVDWEAVHAPPRPRRVPLPTYPFERRRYWIDPEPAGLREQAAERRGRERRELSRWFSVPAWKQGAPLPASRERQGERWVLVESAEAGEGVAGLAGRLAAELISAGGEVVRASTVEEARRALQEAPAHWVDLRPAAVPREPVAEEEAFLDLLDLLGAWSRVPTAELPRSLTFLARGLFAVTGSEELIPERALLLGALRVAPQEIEGLRCRLLEVETARPELAPVLARELLAVPVDGPGEGTVALRGRHRWLPHFEPLELLPAPTPEAGLRPAGHTLITGGLGGLGLTLALFLARSAGARLSLLSRQRLPPRERWDEALGQAGELPSQLTRRISGVRAIEAAGGEVEVLAADVTDRVALARAVAAAETRFGPLRGVIHAAGLPGGALLALRQREEGRRVLAPKLAGTRALLEVLEERAAGQGDGEGGLDFVLLCSSTLGLTGAPGQAEYAAASASLDAYAARGALQGLAARGLPLLAVDWHAWQGVGMAARADEALQLSREEGGEEGTSTFIARLRPDRQWVLAEHRILGTPVLPGTAYLDLALAAARQLRPEAAEVELSDVVFLSPLAVPGGEERWLRLSILRGGELHFSSRGGEAGSWLEHARGRLAWPQAGPAPREGPIRVDLEALQQRLNERELHRDELLPAAGAEGVEGAVFWGPRWQGLEEVRVRRSGGTGPGAGGERRLEALGRVRLPEGFAADLPSTLLHPALLDAATGFAGRLLSSRLYLPISYGRLRFYSSPGGSLWSHVRPRGAAGEEGGSSETLSFDVSLLDEEGKVQVEIEDFCLKRLEPKPEATPGAEPGDLSGAGWGAGSGGGAGAEAGWISPAEGAEAFHRLLARGGLSQVVVSPLAPETLLQAASRLTVGQLGAFVGRSPAPERHHRPDLATPFVPPRSEIEGRLAAIWGSRLGVEGVGVHDNFFELGGDSVLAIQVIAEAQDAGLRLSPNQLFQHPTVGELAALLAAAPPGEVPEARAGGPRHPQGQLLDSPSADGEGFGLADLDAGELAGVLARFGGSGDGGGS